VDDEMSRKPGAHVCLATHHSPIRRVSAPVVAIAVAADRCAATLDPELELAIPEHQLFHAMREQARVLAVRQEAEVLGCYVQVLAVVDVPRRNLERGSSTHFHTLVSSSCERTMHFRMGLEGG
jgi:hypothetical protein